MEFQTAQHELRRLFEQALSEVVSLARDLMMSEREACLALGLAWGQRAGKRREPSPASPTEEGG